MRIVEIHLGDCLLRAAASAEAYFVLVAPFMKFDVLKRILDAIPGDVRGILVTRWRPDEVAVGVSDLEVLDLVHERRGSVLYLCHELHAKYYRFDSTYFVGSANLTATALQWRRPSNIEMLVEGEGQVPEWFEKQLVSASIIATDAIRDVIKASSQKIVSLPKAEQAISNCSRDTYFVEWIPLTRDPSNIHLGLRDGVSEMVDSVRLTVTRDLAFLQLNLAHYEEAYVAIRSLLVQHPLVIAVTAFCQTPQRFGAVRDRIETWMADRNIERNPSEAWQTLMRWMLFYFPEKYSVERPRHSEVFRVVTT